MFAWRSGTRGAFEVKDDREAIAAFGGRPKDDPVRWACPASWGWKSPVQPDGGEARVKRKGETARDRLKEAWSEIAA